MRERIRRIVPYALTAAVVWSLTSVGPSIAAAAYDAFNARQVDGLSAVKATATSKQRAGKLVATNGKGLLPSNLIKRAPDSQRLHGQTLRQVRSQWLSVTAAGNVYGSSDAASGLTVTHPATGTYCVSLGSIVRASVSGNVQSQVTTFEDLSMVVTSLYNTSVCPNEIRVYTAKAGVLENTPFTLTFAMS